MGHLYNYFMDVRNLNQCIRALKKLISSEIVEALSLSDEHDYQNFFKFLFVLPDNLLSISPAA